MAVFAPNSLQLFVDRLTSCSVLTAEEQEAILALPTHAVKLRAKQDFVRLDEETTHCSLIVSGMAGRYRQTFGGARQITAFHIPGDMANLNAAVWPNAAGGLTALCDTAILRIPHDAIRAVAARFPAIAEALWRDCMLDSAILTEWMMNVGRRDAQSRLAHMICEMAIRSGGDREILLHYAFPITQEQLGEAAGLTSVHVNRSLKVLRNKGLATVKGAVVTIDDWPALVRLGQFDATYLVADTAPERQKRLLAEAA